MHPMSFRPDRSASRVEEICSGRSNSELACPAPQNGSRPLSQHHKMRKPPRSRDYSFAMPAPTAASFASVLSSIASSKPMPASPWDDSSLAPDVAVISYERALQAQARVRSSDSVASLPPPNSPHTRSASPRATILTLRLSHAEAAQLHERAAEAGLTVSAYLRSCVFEAEALRTQVREALALFRSAACSDPHAIANPQTTAQRTWPSRLFRRWHATDR